MCCRSCTGYQDDQIVVESIIRDSIVHYLETNALILDSQHGFRKGLSCLSNLLTFLDLVSSMIDSGNNVDVIFMDFAKAFDKVPHVRLGRKLESHGITGGYCYPKVLCSKPAFLQLNIKSKGRY